MRQTYAFVAGEQVVQKQSCSLLDAWLAVEISERRGVVPAEFHRLPIEAYDANGRKLATKTWQQWHAAVLNDTYGSNYQEHLNAAEELAR